MVAQRPRLSVLSLFDPLTSSSDSLDSDKENDCGDSSFFHASGLSKQVYSPVRRLRCRLIDVGEVTVEEPDIRDLIEEELKAEINQSVILEEDDNATLTFRDMAEAATPKWSGKRAGRNGTPNTLSTPRTPLAEIGTRDEITPVGRKKIFKRPPTRPMPQTSPLHVVHIAQDTPTLVIHDLGDTSGKPTFVPLTEILCGDNETTKTSSSPNPMGTSTATLELPTPSGTLISDTPIPLFISSSSPEPNHGSRAPSPLTESRLRPSAHVSKSSNRHSVDLHASFQLHLSSSETIFDLLNDKISFLGSKSGLESFLDHEGASFGDDEDFGTMNHGRSRKMVSNEQRTEHSETGLNTQKLDSETTLEEHVKKSALHDARDRHASLHGRNEIPTSPAGKKSSCILQTLRSVPDMPPSKVHGSVSPTPSPSHRLLRPPAPVPALRIVKRTKALEQARRTEHDRSDSRRASRGKNISAPKRTSPEDASVLTGKSIKNGRQAKAMSRGASSATRDDQSADGPRRVLVTEVPKLQDTTCTNAQSIAVQSKSGISGPRRVPASDAVNKASDTKATGTKQPVKYTDVCPTVSGIPKPVSARNAGSRIPAPPSNKQRIGAQTETGRLLGRRLARK